MAPDCMRVRLHLRLICVLAVVVDTTDQLIVEVASTRRWSRCPQCGFKCWAVHDRRRRKVRDLPVSGRAMTAAFTRGCTANPSSFPRAAGKKESPFGR